MTNAEILEERMDRLQDIQQAMRLLGRDIVQAAPRPVRDPLDDHLRPAFQVAAGGEFAIEVTHAGWPNPAGLKRSTLQRTAYRLQDGILSRLYWTVLDPTLNAEPLVTDLLEEVDAYPFASISAMASGPSSGRRSAATVRMPPSHARAWWRSCSRCVTKANSLVTSRWRHDNPPADVAQTVRRGADHGDADAWR